MGIRRDFSLGGGGGWPGKPEGGRVDDGGRLGEGQTAPGTFWFCVASEDEQMGVAQDDGKDGPALYTPLAVLSGILGGSGGRGPVQRDDGFSGRAVRRVIYPSGL